MVIIAKDYNGRTISIVNAKSKELAMAYWQGKDIYPYTVKSLDDLNDYTPLSEHPTGVYPILETEEKDQYEIQNMKFGSKILCVK